jgi:hypothetical protein
MRESHLNYILVCFSKEHRWAIVTLLVLGSHTVNEVLFKESFYSLSAFNFYQVYLILYGNIKRELQWLQIRWRTPDIVE